MPALMVFLAASAELFGGLALLLGAATRLGGNSIDDDHDRGGRELHTGDNGWFAIASGDPDTSTAKVLAAVGIPAAHGSLENSVEVGERVAAAKSILRRHGNYSWLTEKGSFVVPEQWH